MAAASPEDRMDVSRTGTGNLRLHASVAKTSCYEDKLLHEQTLVDDSDIFYFFLLGEAEGGVRGGGGGGVDFLLKIPGGGVSRRGGAEGPGGCLQRIWELGGGGLNIFFRGRNVHQETICIL